jgi:predicted enzyme related to lactoylglutathione lyase
VNSTVKASHGTGIFGPLRFLYVGSAAFDADVRYYRDSLGAELVWNRKAFGARVAAFHVGTGPLLLLADHRPAPSCLPIFEVDDFEKAMKDLEQRGNRPDKGPLEIPNGPCAIFKDPSGNEFAIFQDVRPNVFG